MLDEQLRAALRAVRPPAHTSPSLPPACYRDEAVFEHERVIAKQSAAPFIAGPMR